MHVTETTHHTATRRQRACDWCGQDITIGERYVRWLCFEDRDATAMHAHVECYGVIAALAAEDGEAVVFDFGSNERPERREP